jgi:hypothetical protein
VALLPLACFIAQIKTTLLCGVKNIRFNVEFLKVLAYTPALHL